MKVREADVKNQKRVSLKQILVQFCVSWQSSYHRFCNDFKLLPHPAEFQPTFNNSLAERDKALSVGFQSCKQFLQK